MIEPFTIKDVEKFVEDNSKCKLVSGSYKNADSIITLKCPCEKEFSLKFRNFKFENIEKIIKEFSTIGQYRGKAQFNICGSP